MSVVRTTNGHGLEGSRAGVRIGRRLVLLLGLLLVFWMAVPMLGSAEGPAVEARLEPERFGVEDTAQLQVTVWDAKRTDSRPRLGKLENLVVVAGPSTETHFSFVNGVATTFVRYTYHVQAERPGPVRVEPVTVQVGDKELTSEPLVAEAVAGSVGSRRRNPQRSPLDPFEGFLGQRAAPRESAIFLRQLVGDREPFLGEPVVVSVVLDTTVSGIEGFSWVDAPSYPGWWAQRIESSEPESPQLVEVDGVRYYRFPVVRSVLIPLKSGELQLPPVSAQIGIRGRSLFSPRQVVERASDPVPVHVKERPYAPQGFSGAVGSFKYQARIVPEEIAFGESASLIIELSGSGNLPLVEGPVTWPTCKGCETYPPEEESDVTVDASGIHGTRQWRTTLLPREWGELRLDPVMLAFFDPAAKTYRQQAVGSLSLRVAPPPPTPTPEVSQTPVAEPGPEAAGGKTATTAPGSAPGWLWIAAALVLGLAVGGVLTWTVIRRQHSVIPPRRSDQAPADRARELQVILERWWLDVDEARTDQLRPEMEHLRKDLEAVRFAPGRADHSQTVADLEHRLRGLLRRA